MVEQRVLKQYSLRFSTPLLYIRHDMSHNETKENDPITPNMNEEKTSTRLGRPRSDKAHRAILAAAIDEVLAVGFRAMGIDAIAARAGVAKTTIYRRWPNKAAVVMDAFLAFVGEATDFPKTDRAIDGMRMQLHAQAKAFRGKYGRLVRAVVGEAQFDPELADAFLKRWRLPRRVLAKQAFDEAISQDDLRKDIDLEVAIDLLYAPLYYRLLIDGAPLSTEYIDTVFTQVIDGLRTRRKH